MNIIEYTLNGLPRYAFFVCLMVVVGACASSNIPAPDTSEAESMVRQAEEAGAQEYAPLELRNARKKIQQAKTFVDNEEYNKATRLTEEASVDAELAMVKARSEKAREAVEQLRATIKTLKEEIERNQKSQGGSL